MGQRRQRTYLVSSDSLSEVEAGCRCRQRLVDHEVLATPTRPTKELAGRCSARRDNVFDTPKPTTLIKRMLAASRPVDRTMIVLDFFAGSGTTGACCARAEQRGRRQPQVHPRPAPRTAPSREDYPTIADITQGARPPRHQEAERRGRRQARLGRRQQAGPRLPRLQAGRVQLHAVGRRGRRTTPSALETQLELHVDHIREGRTAGRSALRDSAQERLPARRRRSRR